tara:strand:- start:125 stop:733 length:609 start_codon:yes stop_codon:yes gene_type:complete
MKIKTIEYSDNRELIIVDDAVSKDKRINIYFDCCVMPYRISNSSVDEIQGIVDRRLKADLTNDNPIVDLLIEEGTDSSEIIKKYIPSESYGFSRGYVNLGIHGDVSHMHTDGKYYDAKTVLYYANQHWEYNWGGNTVFYDNDGNAKTNVEVKPGRIVIFDGSIMHTVMPMNIRSSPSYRFTVALKFETLKLPKFDKRTLENG